jgi:hypothetical protein
MDYTPVSDELHREIIDFAISIAAKRRAKAAARQVARERAAEKRLAVAKRREERLARKAMAGKKKIKSSALPWPQKKDQNSS